MIEFRDGEMRDGGVVAAQAVLVPVLHELPGMDVDMAIDASAAGSPGHAAPGCIGLLLTLVATAAVGLLMRTHQIETGPGPMIEGARDQVLEAGGGMASRAAVAIEDLLALVGALKIPTVRIRMTRRAGPILAGEAITSESEGAIRRGPVMA